MKRITIGATVNIVNKGETIETRVARYERVKGRLYMVLEAV